MKRQYLNDPINVRLSADLKKRIREVAGILGVTASDVIRLSIINQLPKLEEKKHSTICGEVGADGRDKT